MWQIFVKLRKKIWLPRKYRKEKKERASSIEYPPPIELLKKSDEARSAFLKAERESDTLMVSYWNGATEVIDWIINYGEANEKGA